MTDLKNSNSAFASAMREVFSAGEKQEALSAKVLFAMIDLEATFDMAWLEAFFKAENKVKTDIINTALADLYPEFSEVQILAEVKVTDIRKESNPNKKAKMELDKASSQAKIKAAQNMIRLTSTALLYFRSIALDKILLTDRKRIKWSMKVEGWYNQTGLTFKECVEMGKRVAAEKNWVTIEVSKGPKGSSGAASDGSKLSETAKDIGALASTLNTISSILMGKAVDSLSESEEEALRNLEEVIIRRTYANDKGIINFKTMQEYYTDPKKTTKAA